MRHSGGIAPTSAIIQLTDSFAIVIPSGNLGKLGLCIFALINKCLSNFFSLKEILYCKKCGVSTKITDKKNETKTFNNKPADHTIIN